jgi:hypothetical protein
MQFNRLGQGIDDHCHSCFIGTDSPWIASGGRGICPSISLTTVDGKLYIWNRATSELMTHIKAHSDRVRTIDVHPANRNEVVTAGDDKAIMIRHLEDKEAAALAQLSPQELHVLDQDRQLAAALDHIATLQARLSSAEAGIARMADGVLANFKAVNGRIAASLNGVTHRIQTLEQNEHTKPSMEQLTTLDMQLKELEFANTSVHEQVTKQNVQNDIKWIKLDNKMQKQADMVLKLTGQLDKLERKVCKVQRDQDVMQEMLVQRMNRMQGMLDALTDKMEGVSLVDHSQESIESTTEEEPVEKEEGSHTTDEAYFEERPVLVVQE